MSEADERFTARLAEELARHVGRGVVVLGVDLQRHPTHATLVARCAAGGEEFAAEASGETELDAWSRLPSAVSEVRLRRAFVRIVEQ